MWHRQRTSRLAALLAVLFVGSGPGDDGPEFLPLFDGRTIEGWTPELTDRFEVRDGVIVNDGGPGWLRYHKSFKDFEFRADYRAMSKGAETGILFRATAESRPKAPYWPSRSYQVQISDAADHCAIRGHGVALPRFDRKTKVLKAVMKGTREWQTIALKVVGKRAEVELNGRPITACESIDRPEGCIGLQGENGHFEWRNLMIKDLSAR
jgi:hypothetical protein